ncbi:MAG: hypothetical protein ILO34_05805 [Kiritimatiellae bacterium]|nr:hypothetical protein [Kiritimatiellia bacterium]
MKKSKKRQVFETITIDVKSTIDGCDNEEIHRLWSSVAERIDEQMIIDATKAWRAEHKADISFLNWMEIDLVPAAEKLAKTLAEGGSTLSTLRGWCKEEHLKQLLSMDLRISYNACALYDPSVYFCSGEEELDQFERNERFGNVKVPDVEYDDLLQMSDAQSLDELSGDPVFQKLCSAFRAGEDCFVDFEDHCMIRLHEDEIRENCLKSLLDLLKTCAARAKGIGDSVLCRRFLGAKRWLELNLDESVTSFRKVYRHDSLPAEAIDLIAEVCIKDVDGLFVAIEEDSLPAWKRPAKAAVAKRRKR